MIAQGVSLAELCCPSTVCFALQMRFHVCLRRGFHLADVALKWSVGKRSELEIIGGKINQLKYVGI